MSTDMDRVIVTPWWRRQTTLIAVGMAVVVLGGGTAAAVVVQTSRSTIRVNSTAVRVAPVKHGVFRDFTPLRATVIPRVVMTIDAQEGGQVAGVLALGGDTVLAGQPLVRFRNTDLEMQVLERQASIIASISQLQAQAKALEDTRTANVRDKAKLDYDLTRLTTEFERQQALFDKGFASASARDRARDELAYQRTMQPLQAETLARAEALRIQRLPEIEAEVAILRQSLSATRAKLDGLVIRAPAAGRLADLSLTVGETRARGQAIGKLTADAGFKLSAGIDPFYLGRVRVGQTAEVVLPGFDGARRLAARVSRVDPQIKDGAFVIELDFAASPPVQLIEGQVLEGSLALGQDKPAVVAEAGPWLDRSGGNWAMVLNSDKTRADRRRIRIGRRNADQVEVLANLKAGEAIITSSYDAFEKIERVQLVKK